MDRLLDELVALGRSALDRWIRLDPQGYVEVHDAGVGRRFDRAGHSAGKARRTIPQIVEKIETRAS